MIAWLIAVPALGALAAWLGEPLHRNAPRWITLAALAAHLAVLITIWNGSAGGPWIASLQVPWIPELGISFHLALDGLSVPLLLLTDGLGIVAVLASWTEIRAQVGLFHFNLLFTLAGVAGVFLALDLFLFFFCWEAMLVPMYFLIAVWGHEHRLRASIKFFIFTQGSGLLMLLAILALALAHRRATGMLTFDYFALLGTPLDSTTALWLMLGFFVAFAVKLPAFPFHSWLPDAHTEAPTAGSVILAGVLLKTGAYGLLRFVVPLFPAAAHDFAPVAMWLGAIGILYGAVLAFAQSDMKRLVAYSSVSHMGFVMLGVFAWNPLALQGVVVQMIAHGVSTGALFAIVGFVQERLHTRDLRRMGGLASDVPRLAALTLTFAVASLGLPGLGNFVGEFLVLLGSFGADRAVTVVAAAGLVTAVIYALSLVQRALHGGPREPRVMRDTSVRETVALATLVTAIVWLGFYPQPLLDTSSDGIENLQHPQASQGGVTVGLPRGLPRTLPLARPPGHPP